MPQVKKVGTGTQTLSNNNTYTKGTTISGGTLKLTGDGTLGTGAVTIGENGTLEFAYDSAKTFNNSISLSGTIANTSTATLTLSSAITLTGNTTFDTTTDLTVPNIARNDDYTVTKEGSGTLTFSKRTLIKHLTIKEGTMSLNRDSNYGGLLLGSEITVDGNNSVLDGYGNGSTTNNGGVLGVIGYNGADPLGTLCLKNKGTLKNSSQNKCVIISYTVNMENGIITSTGNGDSTYGNYIFDTPVYVKSSQSNLIEASSLTIRNYNNKLSTSACGGIFDVAQDAKLTVTSSIKGSYVPLVKDGEGELVLTGDNVYSQGTTISEGTLKLSGNGTLGTGAVTVSENAELEIAYDNPEKSVSISSITMDLQSAITVTCGTVTFNPGDVSLNNLAGGSLDQSGHTAVASHLVVTGNLTLLNDEDEMSKFIGSISAGNYSITKSGDGTLQLYGEAEGSIDASSLIVSSGRLDLKGCLT
ncbi:MAG: autotransporter-associated beta strand repeat-containing protein, partial [Thermoguttaceae bacterium]|nr:autotransporter-associated beta strand repeat-containing protein [Thermoguttaceae bacterium]